MIQKLVRASLVCFLFTVLFTTTASADKTYRAERFDVQLDLLAGGDMLVTETVFFRFEGGPFTYAFREVSANRTDGLTFLEASMDGVPLPQGTGAGHVEVQPGDPLKVTWHFAPTSDSTHTFVVRYRVMGVVSTGETDTLRWYVIPPDHGYPIDQSTIWLNYPANVRPLETPSLDRTFDSAPTDMGVKLTTTGIADNAGVILTARFPAGSLATTTPAWQVREQAVSAATVRILRIGLLSGVATLLLGGLWLFAFIRANRRELNLPELTPLSVPPDDRVPSAVVGKLIGQDSYTAVGALFDLAQRGVLEIREEKGWLGGKKFIVELKNTGISLYPYEQRMLQAVFKPGETQVNMSDIITRLSSKRSHFDEPLEQELVWRGWLDPERKRKRQTLLIVGLLGMLLGVVLGIGALIGVGASLTDHQVMGVVSGVLMGLGGGVFVLSFPFTIYAGSYSPLTPAGEEQKIRWKGFRTYLDQVNRGRESVTRLDIFERYLALAAALGLGAAWAKTFQKLGGAPLPAWFQATSDTDGFAALVAVMSSADATASSVGADGGGGASGGGASGAG